VLKFAGGGPLPLDPRVNFFSVGPIYGSYTGANTDLTVGGVWLGPMLFVQPVPEPATMMLAALATLASFAYRRRR
jgi:hypothetical protein